MAIEFNYSLLVTVRFQGEPVSDSIGEARRAYRAGNLWPTLSPALLEPLNSLGRLHSIPTGLRCSLSRLGSGDMAFICKCIRPSRRFVWHVSRPRCVRVCSRDTFHALETISVNTIAQCMWYSGSRACESVETGNLMRTELRHILCYSYLTSRSVSTPMIEIT